MPRRPGALITAAGALAMAMATIALQAPIVRAAGGSVVVQPGDTLSGIALRHRTTVARLVALNHLADPDRILAGQRLVLDGGSATVSTTTTAKPPASTPPPAAQVHVVRTGEHLTGIAQQYGTTIDAIVRLNRIANPNRIFAGQKLLVPAGSVAAAPAAPHVAPTVQHRVVAGENLTVIAAHYGTSIAAIVALNHLPDASYIRAGDILRIPDGRSAAAALGPSLDRLEANVVRLMAARTAVRNLIVAEAHRAAVPAAFALAVAWQESGWQQAVVSDAGAIGVMQLLPATGDWVAAAMLQAPVNLHDTRQNVRAGVTLLAHYLARYHGNRSLTLAAYYQGQRSVEEHGIYAVSRPYIASILALEAVLGS